MAKKSSSPKRKINEGTTKLPKKPAKPKPKKK